MSEMNRRFFLRTCSGTLAFACVAACDRTEAQHSGRPPASDREFDLTDTQWRERLTPEQFRILRQEGTERAGSSPLNAEHRAGLFVCAGCGQPLFSSDDKFDSGTGWPSFTRPLQRGNVGEQTDSSLGMTRTEVHCARCGGHQGHVFNDGPPRSSAVPHGTGKRYCINGVALRFEPGPASLPD